MKKRLLFITCCAALSIIACRDQEPSFALEPDFQNNVRFDQPAVGQVSHYLRFEAGSCPGPTVEFKYLSDTLVLEVTKVEGNTVTLTERLTPGSACIKTTDPYDDPWGGGTADITLQLLLENGTAQLLSTSEPFSQTRLFIFPNLVMPLAPITAPAMTIKDWYPMSDNSTAGFLTDYLQLNVQYSRLNTVIDYEPMSWDGAGGLYLYTAELGMVRSGHRSSWCQNGEGWDLMPD